MRLDELEKQLQERLEFWGYSESRVFAELLIDCEDRTLRPVLVGMLRETDRSSQGRR
jgi:hypothetical protein